MDPYSVLGVRKNALQNEIELAYKGRRSQYHPDRYTSEDAETLKWATAQMQEVNKAYALLSDPQSRARFDRASPSASRNPTATASQAGGTPRAEDVGTVPEPSIVDYFTRLRLDSSDQARLFVAPSIPAKKAQNAISARGWEGRWYMCEPLVLVDDTLGGGAKEGLLIGEKCVSFKSLFLDPEEYILQGGFNGGFEARGTKILRMGDVCKEFVHFSSRGVALVCQALNEYFDDLRAWHRARAESGDAESANFMSESCHGDPDQAMHWLRRAADAGLRVAQHNLARNLESKDPAEAIRLFKLAADQGCESSRERLRLMGSKADAYKDSEVDRQREREEEEEYENNENREDDSPRAEPEEGMISDFQRQLLSIRTSRESAGQKALFDLLDWILRSTSAFQTSLTWDGSELDDEERFVLSSDVVRFELFPLVMSFAFNTMLPQIGEAQTKEVVSIVFDEMIVEIILRKEGLDSLRHLPEPEKTKRFMAKSRLIQAFRDRTIEYQEVLASDGDVSSLFLENLEDPMMASLYAARPREIVKTMIADVFDGLLDDETTMKALREVERCTAFAVNNYIGAVYE